MNAGEWRLNPPGDLPTDLALGLAPGTGMGAGLLINQTQLPLGHSKATPRVARKASLSMTWGSVQKKPGRQEKPLDTSRNSPQTLGRREGQARHL